MSDFHRLNNLARGIADTAATAEVKELAGVVAKLIEEVERLEKELHLVRSRSHG